MCAGIRSSVSVIVKYNDTIWCMFWSYSLTGIWKCDKLFGSGKYNMLLRVDNRNYVTTNLGTVTSVATDATRIFLLLHGRSIIAVQTTYLVFNLIKMLYVSGYMKKIISG